jgi:peptidoglycan/xylan/chitin deacetylase (PgdA/CDA1 family)
MSFIKKLNRKIFLPIIHQFAVKRILPMMKKRIILCYHGVLDSPSFEVNNRHIATEQLEKDIIFFKKNAKIYSVKEIHQRNKDNLPVTDLEVAFTFDDGFENNFIFAKPLLEKYSIPASFYIISKSLKEIDFTNWPEQIEHILSSTLENQVQFDNIYFFKKSGWKSSKGVYLGNYVKTLGENRSQLLLEFTKKFSNNHKKWSSLYWKTMSIDQVQSCANSQFITIGSHTHDHFSLNEISLDQAKFELLQSKLILENITGIEVKEIAYPDGSYSRDCIDLAESIGYDQQLAVNYRFNEDLNDNRILNRFSISNSTTHEGNIVRLWLENR